MHSFIEVLFTFVLLLLLLSHLFTKAITNCPVPLVLVLLDGNKCLEGSRLSSCKRCRGLAGFSVGFFANYPQIKLNIGDFLFNVVETIERLAIHSYTRSDLAETKRGGIGQQTVQRPEVDRSTSQP